MGDDDELRAALELVEHPHETPHVRVVQWRVHLVEQAERAGLGEEDAEQQRQRHEGALAAGQQVDALGLLAARRGVDLDVTVERRVRMLQPQVALAAAEQRHEDRAEVLAHLRERGEEQLARGGVDLLDRLEKRRLGVGKVGTLRDEKVVALHRLIVLLDGQRVHRAELLELAAQLHRLGLERVVVDVHERHLGQHLVERALPLRLQSLADRRAAPRQLGEAQLGVMQLVAHAGGPAADLAERVIRGHQRVVGLAHAPFGIGEARLAVGQRGFACLELPRPSGDLLGQEAVGAREIIQLLAELRETQRRGGHLLREPTLAIEGHLHVGSCPGLFHLPLGAELACLLLFLLGGRRARPCRGDHPFDSVGLRAERRRVGIERGAALAQGGGTGREALPERRGILRLLGGACHAALKLGVQLCRRPATLLRRLRRLGGFHHAPLAGAQCVAHGIRRERGVLARGLERRQLEPQFGELRPPPQRSGTGGHAGEPDGAARIHKGAPVVHRVHVTEQVAHPRPRRRRRVHQMGQGVGHRGARRVIAHRVERQQQQGARIGVGVPETDRIGCPDVAHEHRMHRIAEEFLHEHGGALVGTDEVGKRSEHGPLAEPLPRTQERRGRGGKPDAVALQLLERVDATLERRQRLVGAEQLRSRERIALSRRPVGQARRRQLFIRDCDRLVRGIHLTLRRLELALDERERVVERCALERQRRIALLHLVELTHRALAVVLDASRALLQRAEFALGALDLLTRVDHAPADVILRLLVQRELGVRLPERLLHLRELDRGRFTFRCDAGARLLACGGFGLGALPARRGVSLPLLRHRHLAANTLHLLPLRAHEARQLVAPRLGGGARALRGIARGLRLQCPRLGGGQQLAELGDALLEPGQLLAPCVHAARRERDLHREAARHDLGVAFGALALARQAPHLTGDLVDEVVETLEIARRLLETPLGGAAPVAIEPHPGGLLEQLAPVVGTVGEEGIDHPALDHHARARAQPGAPQQIRNVAQPAGRAIEEVVAVARTREAAGDDDLLERHGEEAVVVREVQGDFGHVHGAPRRRALKDDFVHLRPAHEARALLAKHPAHGVGDVGLAAAIGADDRRHPGLEDELRDIGERLEAVQLELGQPH